MSFPSDFSAGLPERGASRQSPPRPLTVQDQGTAAALAAAAELVNRVVDDASLAARLRTQGYDEEELRAGVTLHTAAEDIFAECQQALGDLDQTQADYDETWVNAREEYLEFRWAVRSDYPDPRTRKLLRVDGVVADQMHEFIAQAAMSYRAAQILQSSTAPAETEFTPERLRQALAELRLLARLEMTLQACRSNAERRREERDLAVAMLNLWMRDFERATRAALGGIAHPPVSSWLFRARPLELGHGLHRPRTHRFPARLRTRFPRSRS
ncbi:hypothetical protein Oter_0148 [Opitutus terrae PB90-1]|uniref:Uncharacterized protein n=1 Tax=Opitutus terrae (strain DSM 11246 / JCM 15787 / PB90-1) TaxID=452637 RepID=B1ZN70_OPITP|nr:hypothetical protein Oter_0148 [Opitutus terrae PB90-1]